MKVIVSEGLADGRPHKNGQYLAYFDADALDGMGDFAWTTKKEDALKFKDAAEAILCWRQQSTVRPYRDDGQPNRPLTSFTVSIEEA